MTKFDQVASFWQEFVLEPEEKECQEQRRIRKAKAEALHARAAAVAAGDAGVVGGHVYMYRQTQFMSQDDSSISARPSLHLQHHLGDLLQARASETTATTTGAATDPDR